MELRQASGREGRGIPRFSQRECLGDSKTAGPLQIKGRGPRKVAMISLREKKKK